MGDFANISDNIVEELLKIVPISYFLTEDFKKKREENGFSGRWNMCSTMVTFKGNNILASPIEKTNLVLEKFCQELSENSNRTLYNFISIVIKGYCNYKNTKVDLNNMRVLLRSLGVVSISKLEQYDSNSLFITNIITENNPTANYTKTYRNILSYIYKLCKDYERHESAYRGRQEEDLRDLIVSSLNSVFIGTNSSGETFNRTGKTDIITKAPDNSNIFIAECKIWRGEKMFLEAIDQLLGYVTWRDTKTALILFVKNSGIVEIIDKAKSTIAQHPCYVGFKTETEDSSFAYIFHTKDDSQSHIALELMIFHYPE